MLTATLIGLGWLVCGVLDYGLMLAYFQREYPVLAHEWRGDVARATTGMIMGPIGLIATFICGFHKHGFMWWPPKETRMPQKTGGGVLLMGTTVNTIYSNNPPSWATSLFPHHIPKIDGSNALEVQRDIQGLDEACIMVNTDRLVQMLSFIHALSCRVEELEFQVQEKDAALESLAERYDDLQLESEGDSYVTWVRVGDLRKATEALEV